MASGALAYLVGCGVAYKDTYEVGYLQKRMVLTEATGNGELVVLSFKNTYRRFPIEVEQRVSYHLPHIYVQSSRDRPAGQLLASQVMVST